jgi:hypothetical protein
MTKNTKMLLGVGAVAVVGYWLWKKQSTTTSWTGSSNYPPAPRLRYASGTSKLASDFGCNQKMKPTSCVSPCYSEKIGMGQSRCFCFDRMANKIDCEFGVQLPL